MLKPARNQQHKHWSQVSHAPGSHPNDKVIVPPSPTEEWIHTHTIYNQGHIFIQRSVIAE